MSPLKACAPRWFDDAISIWFIWSFYSTWIYSSFFTFPKIRLKEPSVNCHQAQKIHLLTYSAQAETPCHARFQPGLLANACHSGKSTINIHQPAAPWLISAQVVGWCRIHWPHRSSSHHLPAPAPQRWLLQVGDPLIAWRQTWWAAQTAEGIIQVYVVLTIDKLLLCNHVQCNPITLDPPWTTINHNETSWSWSGSVWFSAFLGRTNSPDLPPRSCCLCRTGGVHTIRCSVHHDLQRHSLGWRPRIRIIKYQSPSNLARLVWVCLSHPQNVLRQHPILQICWRWCAWHIDPPILGVLMATRFSGYRYSMVFQENHWTPAPRAGPSCSPSQSRMKPTHQLLRSHQFRARSSRSPETTAGRCPVSRSKPAQPRHWSSCVPLGQLDRRLQTPHIGHLPPSWGRIHVEIEIN